MRRWLAVFLTLVVLLLSAGGCGESSYRPGFDDNTRTESQPVTTKINVQGASGLQVHFIDVGQGDAILVIAPGGSAMLVDGGESECGQTVVDYLHSRGIKKLTVLVATHPHADHIGGLPAVLNNFPVDRIYMPEIANDSEQISDLRNAIHQQGLQIQVAQAGGKLPLPGVDALFLAPDHQDHENPNDASAVIRLKYKNTSFLLTGDASEHSEDEMLDNGMNLDIDVLKVGHHGSHSSTSQEFVEAASPQYAVIMCGIGNAYGHPHWETLETLSEAGTKIYRTDLAGNIVMKSDGESIKVISGGDSHTAVAKGNNQLIDTGTTYYIGNRNSYKFHRPDCSALPSDKNRVIFKSREEAIKNKYDPCQRCLP